MIGKIILRKGRIQAKFHAVCKYGQLMGLPQHRGTATAGTFCNLYTHLCLETVLPALKLTQNCYLHYNINTFS